MLVYYSTGDGNIKYIESGKEKKEYCRVALGRDDDSYIRFYIWEKYSEKLYLRSVGDVEKALCGGENPNLKRDKSSCSAAAEKGTRILYLVPRSCGSAPCRSGTGAAGPASVPQDFKSILPFPTLEPNEYLRVRPPYNYLSEITV